MVKIISSGDIMNIVFNNESLTLVKKSYSNGRPALTLVDSDGMPYMCATVNLPDESIDDTFTFIKDYSENEGILQVLVDAGVVSETNHHVRSGHVFIPLVRVLI